MQTVIASLQNVIAAYEPDRIIQLWMDDLATQNSELMKHFGVQRVEQLCRVMIDELFAVIKAGQIPFRIENVPLLEKELNDLSKAAVLQGLPATAIAPCINALKYIFARDLLAALEPSSETGYKAIILLDQVLGVPYLHYVNFYLASRERVIYSQARAIDELSTPVIQIWDDILAMPLIGEIDTARAKSIMENLLKAIIDTKSTNVILDITGVPIVDTGVAERLIKTVEAARLLGANCVLTGIRPEVAQTIVLLGVNLGEIVTKATLRAGLAYLLSQMEKEGKREAAYFLRKDRLADDANAHLPIK